MTTEQFSKLLSEPWRYEGREMTFYTHNRYTGKMDKKRGTFKGFNPIILTDGSVRVERILLANYGLSSIPYSDVVFPKSASIYL